MVSKKAALTPFRDVVVTAVDHAAWALYATALATSHVDPAEFDEISAQVPSGMDAESDTIRDCVQHLKIAIQDYGENSDKASEARSRATAIAAEFLIHRISFLNFHRRQTGGVIGAGGWVIN